MPPQRRPCWSSCRGCGASSWASTLTMGLRRMPATRELDQMIGWSYQQWQKWQR